MSDTAETRPGITARAAVAAASFVAIVAGLIVAGAPLGPGGITAAGASAPAVYPIPAPELTTDKSTYEPNGRGIVRLDGFNGCPSVTIVIEGVPGSIEAVPDENGTVTVEVTMPGEPGDHTITAECTVGEQSASGTITVREPGTVTVPTDPPTTDPVSPSTTSGGGQLPTTGSQADRPVIVGLVLLVSGAGFVLVTRLRRRHALR